MKNILIIHGGKRKKNTYALLEQIIKNLELNNCNVELVFLHEYNIKDCVGCELCLKGSSCKVADDTKMILDKMIKSDGIILSSPVYLRHVTGKIKTIIDRTCHWFHCPPLTNKPLLAVSTTMGSGLKETLSYLESLAEQWGAMPAGQIGRSARNMNEPIDEKELKNFYKLLNNPEKFKPSLSNLINFQVQKSLALCILTQDKPYWEEKNWVNSPYYQKAKINPVKKLLSNMIGNLIRIGMSKNN